MKEAVSPGYTIWEQIDEGVRSLRERREGRGRLQREEVGVGQQCFCQQPQSAATKISMSYVPKFTLCEMFNKQTVFKIPFGSQTETLATVLKPRT